jgi:S1-C subfamily serine protease
VRRLSLSLALLFTASGALADAPTPELAGASPGERSAIEAICGDVHGAPRQMCYSNQIANIARLGRKPDLAVASGEQRRAIEAACAGSDSPGAKFACQRRELASDRLPVRNEPGGGQLGGVVDPQAASIAKTAIPKGEPRASFPFFSLIDWRKIRPAMPPARNGATLAPESVYAKISPSIYIVTASQQTNEAATGGPYSLGSGVAVSSRVLITNCHVVGGLPHIKLAQQGQSGRATLIYADPAGDRCFLRSDDMVLNPVQGVQRFEDLHVGETVYSIGTPSGLELSFGAGLISGLRQSEGVRYVQNSAPSWHGSSGGGLFDAHGNLIGITTAGSATVANLNFSIAAEDFWP